MGVCLNQELVERYTAGSCSEDEHRTVEAHLVKCKNCRQRVESIRSKTVDASYQSDSADTDNKNAPYTFGKETHSNKDEYRTVSISDIPSFTDNTSSVVKPVETMYEGYEILEQLPAGGQAIVYKATQKATKRIVALKVLLQGPQASARAQYRFEREVDLAASLKHSNIVTIYDSGITRGQYYFAMEYIDGKSLDKFVQDEKLSLRQTMELFNKVCSAVAYAHQRGVMHRDLKPGNILVDANGEPHILDFGLAKLVDSSLEDNQDRVMTSMPGKLIGTLAFMSPEQASCQPSAIDVRSDVYSIGVILYRILTNDFPYDLQGSTLAILRNIQEVEPRRPSKILRRFDSEVEAILLKALAKDPSYRYQSSVHLQHDIEYWLKGLPITAKSNSSIYLLRKIISQHYYTSSVIALLLIIILGFSSFYYQLYTRLRQTNITLQNTIKSLNKETAQYANVAREVTFTEFLHSWHANQLRQSQSIARYFIRGTKEAKAANFLLNQKSIAEKVSAFRQNIEKNESCFVEFVIAEHYLKNGNRPEAMRIYQECLSHKDYLEKNRLLAIKIKSRLYELDNNNLQDKTSMTVDN
jgi:serine/threonine protein kinase